MRAPGYALALDLFSDSAGETPQEQPAGRRRYLSTALHKEDGLSQMSNLLHVMQAMHEMKLSPLTCGEWTENGMVQHFAARAKVMFAAGNAFVHFGDFCPNLGQHLFWRQSARTRDGRGFPA